MSHNRCGYKWPGLFRVRSGNHFTYSPLPGPVPSIASAVVYRVWERARRRAWWLRLLSRVWSWLTVRVW